MCICERVLLIFSHCQQVTSLAAAVRAPYLCALPSASYFSAIGHPLTVAAAAYLCDCDPLDHGTHDTPGILLLVASFLYKELHKTALREVWRTWLILFRILFRVSLGLESLWKPCMKESTLMTRG